MIDSPSLLHDLQREVTKLHADLRARCDAQPAADAPLKSQYDAARAGQRTALPYKAWREEELTNVAVAWVLACVFIRFLEDNGLVETLHLAGAEAAGLGRARDQQIVYFREHAGLSEREYLEHVFTETAKLPGMADLFDRRHNPLWTVGPTGDAARAFIEFWRRTDAESGRPVHDFSDPDWNTRFLGDLYQDLSEAARKRYALLQTPVFIEQFILDRTLTPAIATFGFRAVRMIDPTCGSGHFLLGGFARLCKLWNEALPGEVPSVVAQHALDQVYGVDLNPNVVAIARFRLLLAALRACGTAKLRHAYDFKIHITAGDALLHGRRFRESESFTPGAQRTFDTEELFRDELKHHYEVEDVEALHRILGQQYHAVVGNPPYITVKDRAVSELYRARYPSCHRKYSLSVPFMERFFDLAVKGDGTPQQPAGFVGQITSNSFMKREFGKKLIEEYLPRWDLTHVLDTAGTYIPGHNSEGTPTVTLFGKNQSPVNSTIRTVLGIRGEPATPAEPALGLVWQAVVRQIDEPGSVSEWMSANDSPRDKFHHHPWSIGGGGAAELKDQIEAEAASFLRQHITAIGFLGMTHADEAMLARDDDFRRAAVESITFKPLVAGDVVRDWQVTVAESVLFPYDPLQGLHGLASFPQLHRWLWPMRTPLGNRATFSKATYFAEGRAWWEWHQVALDRLSPPLTITFAFVATHNHFVLESSGNVFKQTAPVIKLPPSASHNEHVALLGTLNSSTVCFWLRAVSQAKSSFIEAWETRYEFDSAKVKQIPIPARQPTQLPTTLVQTSTALQAQSPAATLASWNGPEKAHLRSRLAAAAAKAALLRQQMIAWQEELDWQIYEAYGLVDAAHGVSLAEEELARGGHLALAQSEVVASPAEGERAARGSGFAAAEGVSSGHDGLLFASEGVPSASDKGLSGAEKGFSSAEKGLSGPPKGSSHPEGGLSAAEQGFSATDKVMSGGEKGPSGADQSPSNAEKTPSAALFTHLPLCPPLALGERAFEIVLARRMAAGEVQTTWFERHGSTPITELPCHWPAAYRELVERRIARIAEDPNIRLIEQPEYKRRWNTEPWDEQFTKAARDWLLTRLEGYFFEGDRVLKPDAESARAARTFAPATRPALTTTNQLAEIAKTDAAFQAVAEQLKGGPGFSVPKLVRELVELASVPFLPAQRYKPSGLLKRHDWEHVWELQRREDAIDAAEKVDEPGLSDPERTRRKLAAAARKKAELGDLPVPPKYASGDFKKSVWWSLRGKLDVPKERWTIYPGTERTEDPSPVLAWAGWDHAQQARALAEYYMDAKTVFGFAEEQRGKVLALLLASLQELQPWLDQWHSEVDPAFGVSPGDAIRGFADAESQALGVTGEDLRKVRMST